MTDIKPDLVITDLPDPSPNDPLEALSWLGDTAEEVAEGLRARGIKGKRQIANSCPLARYLSQFGFVRAIAAGKCWQGLLTEEMPPACNQFANLFDVGTFPDLIEP